MSISESIKPAALTAWAYKTIKEDILNFRIQPGTQLHIEKLAEQMDISRTPIREALLKLEADGLVKTLPRVGFFVTDITKRDLKELFELRDLLECHATRKAAPLLTDDDLKYLDTLLAESIPAVEQGNLDKFLEIDIALHTLLIERAQNRRLIAMMESIRDLTYRERVLSLRSSDNVRETLHEHQRIVEALHQRNGELASRRMSEHLHAVSERLMQLADIPDESAANSD